MVFALLVLMTYAVWCCLFGLREELACRRYCSEHGWTCWVAFPFWLILAPYSLVLGQTGPFGGSQKDLSRFNKSGSAPATTSSPLPRKVKIPLILLSLATTLWSFWLLFGPSRTLFVVFFLVCHEGGHALWGLRRHARITGVGAVPFLGAFVAFAKDTTPAIMGEVALVGLLTGLLPLLTFWFFADPAWNIFFVLIVTIMNALPWGPFDGKKCWVVVATKMNSRQMEFYRKEWTFLCVGAFCLVEGLYGMIK